jgi:hypothetical protein
MAAWGTVQTIQQLLGQRQPTQASMQSGRSSTTGRNANGLQLFRIQPFVATITSSCLMLRRQNAKLHAARVHVSANWNT